MTLFRFALGHLTNCPVSISYPMGSLQDVLHFPSLPRIFFADTGLTETINYLYFLIFGAKWLFRRYHNILWYIFLDIQDIFLYIVSKFVPKYQRFETTQKRKVYMGKSLIKCPKDPKIQYYREVCTEIFRKGNLRKWCKHCEVFHDQKKSAGDA